MVERDLTIERSDVAAELFGAYDGNIKLIERGFGVSVVMRDSSIRVIGEEDNVERAVKALEGLISLIERGDHPDEQAVRYAVGLAESGSEESMNELDGGAVCVTIKGKPVKAKTHGQQKYIDAIRRGTITFGVGPAGTGKTYLAVALAVTEFRAGGVERIILTRPAVEAGEKLGFLPGDLQHKVDPYLRPLYDALFEMLGAETFMRLQERGNIEVAPLAYMRGRTLDNSFIILDEAQNTTNEQMKMFLTRLGFGSRMVVTGDVTQIDLPEGKKSGLVEATRILRDIEGISTVRFTQRDVVRHHLVQDIITAYEKNEEKRKHVGKGQG